MYLSRNFAKRRGQYQQKYGTDRFITSYVRGAEGLGETIDSIIGTLSNPEPFLRRAATIIGTATAKNFERGGTQYKMWEEILETSRARRRVDGEAPVLNDSRALARAASATQEGVEDSIFSIEGNSLTMGTDRIDAHLHQYGKKVAGVRPDGTPKGWPARPFLAVTGNELRRIKISFDNLIAKGVEGG